MSNINQIKTSNIQSLQQKVNSSSKINLNRNTDLDIIISPEDKHIFPDISIDEKNIDDPIFAGIEDNVVVDNSFSSTTYTINGSNVGASISIGDDRQSYGFQKQQPRSNFANVNGKVFNDEKNKTSIKYTGKQLSALTDMTYELPPLHNNNRRTVLEDNKNSGFFDGNEILISPSGGTAIDSTFGLDININDLEENRKSWSDMSKMKFKKQANIQRIHHKENNPENNYWIKQNHESTFYEPSSNIDISKTSDDNNERRRPINRSNSRSRIDFRTSISNSSPEGYRYLYNEPVVPISQIRSIVQQQVEELHSTLSMHDVQLTSLLHRTRDYNRSISGVIEQQELHDIEIKKIISEITSRIDDKVHNDIERLEHRISMLENRAQSQAQAHIAAQLDGARRVAKLESLISNMNIEDSEFNSSDLQSGDNNISSKNNSNVEQISLDENKISEMVRNLVNDKLEDSNNDIKEVRAMINQIKKSYKKVAHSEPNDQDKVIQIKENELVSPKKTGYLNENLTIPTNSNVDSNKPYNELGTWVWCNGKITRHSNMIPWNIETYNNGLTYEWSTDAIEIVIKEQGIYEVKCVVFSSVRPSLQLLINGSTVVSALSTGVTPIVHHKAGYQRKEENSGNSDPNEASPEHDPLLNNTNTKGGPDSGVTGVTLAESLCISSNNTRLSIRYRGGRKGRLGHGLLTIARIV